MGLDHPHHYSCDHRQQLGGIASGKQEAFRACGRLFRRGLHFANAYRVSVDSVQCRWAYQARICLCYASGRVGCRQCYWATDIPD